MTLIESVGFGIFGLMIIQHMFITKSARGPDIFHRAWTGYRRHVHWCNGCAVAVLLLVGALLAVDAFHNPSDPIVLEHILQVTKARGYLTVALLALFLSTIKIIVERHLQKYLKRKDPSMRDPWQKDVWLIWFVVSVVITFPLELGNPTAGDNNSDLNRSSVQINWPAEAASDDRNIVLAQAINQPLGGTQSTVAPRPSEGDLADSSSPNSAQGGGSDGQDGSDGGRSGDERIRLGEFAQALLILLVIVATYVAWIHGVIYQQLTAGDGFIASVIPPLHLNVFPLDTHSPAQALIIGPKRAGKTMLARQCDPDYGRRLIEDEEQRSAIAERRGKSQESNGSHRGTEVIEEASMTHKVPVRRRSGSEQTTDVKFSLLDFPGENIGDHCTLPLDLRCDVLVLVLPEQAFNPELDTLEETISISKSYHIDKYFGERDGKAPLASTEGEANSELELVEEARDYLYALYYGLNYDRGKVSERISESISQGGRRRSSAKTFVLVVNRNEKVAAGKERYGGSFEKHILFLSGQVGAKFGVPAELCFAEYVDVKSRNTTIFIDALTKRLRDDERSL